MRVAVVLLFLVVDPVLASVATASTAQANLTPAAVPPTATTPGTQDDQAAVQVGHPLVPSQALSQLRPIIYMMKGNSHRRGAQHGRYHFVQMRQSDEPLTHEACEAGTYFIPAEGDTEARCEGCPRNHVSEDGALNCTACADDEQPDGDQAECVKINDAVGAPVWLFKAYLGLLMTLSLLSSLAYLSEYGDQVYRHSPALLDKMSYYLVHYALPIVTFIVVTAGAASITGNYSGGIIMGLFLLFLATKLVVLILVWKRYNEDGNGESDSEDKPSGGMVTEHKNPIQGHEKELTNTKTQVQVVPEAPKKESSKKEPSKAKASTKDLTGSDLNQVSKTSKSTVGKEPESPPTDSLKDKFKAFFTEGRKKIIMSVLFHLLTVGLALYTCVRIMTDSTPAQRYLRRGDFTVMFLLQAMIQMNMAVMLQTLVAKEGRVDKRTLMLMVSNMLLHAILLPMGVTWQLHTHPNDSITDEQFNTVFSVSNFYALIVAGLGVALSIMQEAGTGADEALKKSDMYAEQVVRITKWLANNPCPNEKAYGPDKLERKLKSQGDFFQLRIQEVFNKLDGEVICQFGATLKTPFAWGETGSDLCPKLTALKATELTTKCAVRRAVLEELQQFLVVEAKKTGNVLKMNGSFVLLLMLGAGYFQAINDIIEGFSEMHSDRTFMPNIYASAAVTLVACAAFVFSFFLGGGVEMAASECTPAEESGKCKAGFFRDLAKCDGDTPCIECAIDVSHLCPDDTYYVGKARCEAMAGVGEMPKTESKGAVVPKKEHICKPCPDEKQPITDLYDSSSKNWDEVICSGVVSGGMYLEKYVSKEVCQIGKSGKSLLDVCEPADALATECYGDKDILGIQFCGHNKYYVGSKACSQLEKEKTKNTICKACPKECHGKCLANAAGEPECVESVDSCAMEDDEATEYCGDGRYFVGVEWCTTFKPEFRIKDTMCPTCSTNVKGVTKSTTVNGVTGPKTCPFGCKLNRSKTGPSCLSESEGKKKKRTQKKATTTKP